MTDPGVVLGVLLVKPALVLTAAAVIVAFLRRQSAAARHAVWTAAIGAIVALPVLTLALPPLRVPIVGRIIERSFPAVSRDVPGDAETATPAAPNGRGPTGSGLSGDERRDARDAGDLISAAILAVWFPGVLVLAVRRAMAEALMRRMLRAARSVSYGRVQRLCTDIARRSDVRRPIELRFGDEATTPAVAGVFRPVLLLPASVETWHDDDIAAVLVHEFGHVVRRDALLNAVADLSLILYWCNPLVHLAVRLMRTESERACDDRVLRGGADPEGYAQLLLDVARNAHRKRGLPPAATAMARRRGLESRILAVLDARAAREPLARWMTAVCAGLVFLVALPAATLTVAAAPLQVVKPAGPEPDRLADALAGPQSERLPMEIQLDRVPAGSHPALVGPDSLLARLLVAALAHEPRHEGDLVRDRAAWALSRARDGRLVEPLLDALDSRDWRVQSYAAWALGSAHDARALAPLIPLLQHPVWRLRAMAASSLRALHDPRAATAMRAALTDPAWQVRVEAVEYFAAIRFPALATTIRPLLYDRHVAVRHAAERALTSR